MKKLTKVLAYSLAVAASVNAACHNGGITKVSWVSYSVDNILGAYGVYTTTVYGD